MIKFLALFKKYAFVHKISILKMIIHVKYVQKEKFLKKILINVRNARDKQPLFLWIIHVFLDVIKDKVSMTENVKSAQTIQYSLKIIIRKMNVIHVNMMKEWMKLILFAKHARHWINICLIVMVNVSYVLTLTTLQRIINYHIIMVAIISRENVLSNAVKGLRQMKIITHVSTVMV